MDLGGAQLGGSRSQSGGRMAAGAGTSECWQDIFLHGLRASLRGLCLGSSGLPHSMAAQGSRMRVLQRGSFSYVASEVLECHFYHIPSVISESQAYPGSWGKELDFSSQWGSGRF